MSSANLIPAAMRIHGRVTVDGDLIVEGSFIGALAVSGSVRLAATAQCQASVQARVAHVHGAFTGVLMCSERIVVGPGARVLGDLSAPEIEVDPTAEIAGEILRGAAPAGLAAGSRVTVSARTVGLVPAPRPAPAGRTEVELRGPAPRRPVPPGDPDERTARLFVAVRRPDDRPVPRAPRPRGRVTVVRKTVAPGAAQPGAGAGQ
jgi:cytoskeletal protein CcmA (bactofilin family)